MSDKKISQLTASATPLAGTEVLPIVQSGSTVKVSVSDLTAGRDVLASKLGVGGAAGSFTITSYGPITSTTGDSLFAGSLGIGTGPTYRLDVVAGAGAANLFRVAQSGVSNGFVIASTGSEFSYTFNTGNIVIGTAGKGIDFSATGQATGMTSELLADYEEGTWTPTQGPGLTVSGTFSSSGKYTKVGRQVTVTAELNATTSVVAAGGSIACGGLPFTVVGAHAGSLTSNALAQSGSCASNSTFLYSGTTTSAATGLILTATYFV
jgi:hypothetical protein